MIQVILSPAYKYQIWETSRQLQVNLKRQLQGNLNTIRFEARWIEKDPWIENAPTNFEYDLKSNGGYIDRDICNNGK